MSLPDAGDACTVASCSDNIECTVDGCDAAGSCTHVPDNAKCTGGKVCSATAGCVAEASACVPANCNDNIACTVDGCGANDQCIHVPDNSLCTNGGTCSATTGCSEPAMCSESPCKLVSPQCGCESGEACYPGADGPECAPAGNVAVGGVCEYLDDCRAGLSCVGPVSALTGTCKTMCNSNSDCTGAGARCNALSGSTDKVCSLACNPAAQTGCTLGMKCEILGSSAAYYTDCALDSGSGEQDDTCSAVSPCAAGFRCAGAGRCYQYCKTDLDCPGSLLCDPPSFVIGTTTYGLCQ
jgi:hypothetical protein